MVRGVALCSVIGRNSVRTKCQHGAPALNLRSPLKLSEAIGTGHTSHGAHSLRLVQQKQGLIPFLLFLLFLRSIQEDGEFNLLSVLMLILLKETQFNKYYKSRYFYD